MRTHCRTFILVVAAGIFLSAELCPAGFFDSVTDSLSKAADVVKETTGDVVDGAKSMGEEIGILDKEEKQEPEAKPKPKPEYKYATTPSSTEPTVDKAPEPTAAEQDGTAEKQQEAGADAGKAEMSCEDWSRKLEQFMGGEKGLMAYPTDDQQLLAGWRITYGEAEATLSDYPAGLCPRADSNAKYVRQKLADFKEMDKQAQAELAAAKADKGGFFFSGTPFKSRDHSDLRDTFTAGEPIYGIIRLTKPFAEIYGKKKNFQLRVDVRIDGRKIHAQFITIKSSDYANRDFLVFNVAPDPSELVAYSDQNIEYGKSTATTIQGPNELTHHLGSLTSGSHKFEFGMYYYGKNWAEGSFTVSGDAFAEYGRLHESIAKGVVSQRTLPAAGMKNEKLEQTMVSLLQNAGWGNVYRLNIVDKDWWIERVDGGDTPVKSRYLAAAALAQKDDGSYFYKKCTFHQDKLITGGFGDLYLSHQGDEVPINKENIDN